MDTTYRELIRAAFQPTWWRSDLIVVVAPNGSLSFVPRPNRPLHHNEYTMLEYNFALYFGLSVQLYEMTLISDQAPVDRFFEGHTNALTAKERRGMEVFTGESACAGCHSGAEFTDNSSRILFGAVVDGVQQPAELVERMFNGECEVVAYDQGVYNLGVRPTEEDLGMGNNDPFGNPLAFIKLLTLPASQIPAQELLTFPLPNIANPPIAIGERTVTDGTFKVPSLRNLELTAPYFHNGGQRTIRDVVEFYNRGGDFREHNVLNIDFEIGKLNLTERGNRRPGGVSRSAADGSAGRAAARPVRPSAVVRPERPSHAGEPSARHRRRRRARHPARDPGGRAARRAPLPGFLEGVFGPRP